MRADERSAGGPNLRALMVTSQWPRASWGGTPTFIVRQAEFLRAAGVDLDVYHFKGGRSPGNYLRAWWDLRRKLRRGAYDLVHAQFGQSALAVLPTSLPLVVTFRGDDLQGILAEDGRITLAGRFLRALSRMVARRARAVIVVSEHMKRDLDPGTQASVIPSGLDLTLFRPLPRDEARRRAGVSPDERIVLFVGKPTQARKRLELAKAAVEILNRSLPARLLVGYGVPHTEIPWLMNASDVLLFTSRQEGSPNVVKEALACDLPVVSVAVGDVPTRLAGIEGCEVTADDEPSTLAASLERVLKRGRRVAGRQAVAELDEHVLTGRVLEIYRSVAGAGPAGVSEHGGHRPCVAS
jgi:glycosyltransferase involved in cell wall biosynthesis